MTELPRISRPADDALHAAGLRTLEHVVATPRATVADLHGMGPKGMRILQAAIERAGIGPWR